MLRGIRPKGNESEVEILLVEDNPGDAELTLRALKKRNLANHLVWVKLRPQGPRLRPSTRRLR